MLAHLSPQVHGLIMDMDGVLWRDDQPLGDLPAIFRRIHNLGLEVVLATNNASRTAQDYLARLKGFGVHLEARHIVTSSEAAARMLSRTFPQKGPVFVVGERGIVTAIEQAGFTPITDPEEETRPLAVVAGIDRTLTYPKLRRATLHIRSGVPFYGTNPDKTFPTPAGLVPGAGAILAALEAASGIRPIIIGKPSPLMFEIALERLGLPAREVLVIGDRLETDIAAGQALGSPTALVLSGVSSLAEAEMWTPQPTLIAKDLSELIGVAA